MSYLKPVPEHSTLSLIHSRENITEMNMEMMILEKV
jgi:hypothetical protein